MLVRSGRAISARWFRIHSAVSAAALVATAAGAAKADVSFSDIANWTGTGSNSAALVIDWESGGSNSSLVWGYHWNGSATGEQMLESIVAADPRLYALESDPGEFGGESLFGLGYHASGDGNFTLSPPLSFNAQHLAFTSTSQVDDGGDGNPVRTATTSGDQWAEGWNAAFWGYDVSTASSLTGDPSQWNFASSGFTDDVLSTGEWEGWVFEANFNDDATPALPTPATVVPEPATAALIGAAIGILSMRRRQCVAR